MKKATKKWIAYLLTLTMLLSVATPVFGAEPGTEEAVPETVQTQEAVQSTEKSADEISQEQVSEKLSVGSVTLSVVMLPPLESL